MHAAGVAASQAWARASLYTCLAQVFSSPPTEEKVGELCAIATTMRVAAPEVADCNVSELQRDYMELLVVPGPRYVAPYESVFRDQWDLPPTLPRGSNPGETGRVVKGPLMGESTLAVRRWYLEAGVLPEQDLPDHLANELRFLAYLCSNEAEAGAREADGWRRLRRKFCREHLLQWVGQLREAVSQRDPRGYYRAALEVLELLLLDEENASAA